MARVTSKLQVTIPKVIADRYGIAPGSDIDWSEAGDAIRVTTGAPIERPDPRARLALFDRATARQAARPGPADHSGDRGWTREELYDRGAR